MKKPKKPNKVAPPRLGLLVNFLFELGMQKKIEHSGLKFAGVKHPDTLGEHTSRASQIGLILAMEEGCDPGKVALMCLMHDIGEIRIGDAHRIAQRYLNIATAEATAVLEQTENLPAPHKKLIHGLWTEFNEQKTLEAKVARDADLLETILQAKEYLDNGYRAAERWLSNGSKYLKTRTAKSLYKEIKKTHFAAWWNNLNKV